MYDCVGMSSYFLLGNEHIPALLLLLETFCLTCTSASTHTNTTSNPRTNCYPSEIGCHINLHRGSPCVHGGILSCAPLIITYLTKHMVHTSGFLSFYIVYSSFHLLIFNTFSFFVSIPTSHCPRDCLFFWNHALLLWCLVLCMRCCEYVSASFRSGIPCNLVRSVVSFFLSCSRVIR